jgi:hypothetical protein
MKNYIRTILLVVLGAALVATSANAQARRWQLAPPQNGGMAAWHQLATNGQKQVDEKRSQYTWVELDPLHTGAGYCYADAHAINNSDQVIVDWSDPNDPTCYTWHASLWEKGKWTLVDYPFDPSCGEQQTYLTSITDWGFAFGTWWSLCDYYYEPAAGIDVKSKRWSSLPDIPGFYNQGISMSDNGLAAGFAWNADNTVFKHWVWDGSKYIFPTFKHNWDVNTWWAGPLFINNRGQIAGEYFDTTLNRERGYLQEGSNITSFDAPNAPDGTKPTGTWVNGMNNDGFLLLVGEYDNPNSPYYPDTSFLFKAGKFTALPNPPGTYGVMSYPAVFGVNERGDMVGRWWDTNNQAHTYIAFKH